MKTFLWIEDQKDKVAYTFWKGALGECWLLPGCEWTKREDNDIVLDVDQLSTSCKAILNVLYFPDKVFCLKECGDNVLEVLYRLKDGYVYSSYPLIPFDLKSVMVQDNNGKRQKVS